MDSQLPTAHRWRAHLFGTFSLWRGKQKLALPASSAARALLAYLLLNRAQPLAREVALGLFFPEMPDARARRALSQALWHIRRILPRLVEADAETIQMARDASIWVDVEEFKRISDSSSSNLKSAIDLYRGDLLDGLYDDWVLAERERLREMYLHALEQVASDLKATGDFAGALQYAQRLVTADPLRESAHREVMRLLCALDRPDAALKQFAVCRQMLRTEFALEPEAETRALAEEIAQRREHPAAPYLPTAHAPAASLQPLPLIGRRAERAQLVAVIQALFHQRGGIALIEGEAGVGKTRLLQEIARDAEWRGAQVLWGYCQEAQTSAPYAPVLDALAQGLSPLRAEQLRSLVEPIWLQTLAPLVPNLVPASQPPAPLDPKQERTRLIEALARVLTAWARLVPLVLILEDLHWAGHDTLELLTQLAPRLGATRVLLIGSLRGDEARTHLARWEQLQSLDASGLCARLVLTRLDAPTTRELIRRALGLGSAAPRFETRVHRETDGNPLFVLETLRTLTDEGLLTRDANGTWRTPWDETTDDYAEMPLPRVVERVIARRLAQLTPEARRILRAAAVLGNPFDLTLLHALTDDTWEALLARIVELTQRHFVEETPTAYRFTHDKLCQVCYAESDAAERRAWHLRAARALERAQPERLDARTHHFFAAEEWRAAAHAAQRAGEQAARVYAHRDAVAQFTRALDALAHLRDASPLERFEAYAARERACDQLGERRAQADDLRALEELLDDPALDTPTRRAQIALRRAIYLDALTDYPAAFTAIAHAAELAHAAADAEIEYHARVRWGRMLRQRGEYADARAQFDHAFALARQRNDSLAQATVLNDLGVIAFNAGNFDAALTNFQRALELARDDPKTAANIRNSLGNFYHYTADYAASLAHYDQVLAWRRASGDRLNEAGCLYNIAVVQSDRGDHDTARRALQEVAEIAHALGERRIEGYAVVFLGVVFEHLNDLDAAEEAYTRGVALRRAIGLEAMAIDPLAGLARVATARGDHTRARQFAEEVLTWLTTRGIAGVGDALLAYTGAYRALLAAGETARGMAALQAAYDLLTTQAATIADEERRRAFIHDISPGQVIWEDYHTRVETARPRLARVRLPRAGAPTGRARRDDEYVEIVWTLAAMEDDAIADKTARRQHRLRRLLAEAAAQGAAPTHAQLADALGVGVRTVERDVGRMRDEG